MNMKLLLYCTKAKPYLYPHFHNIYFTKNKDYGDIKFNGKIVAECDFEVEEIDYRNAKFVFNRYYLEVLDKSCLTDKEMYDYLKGKNGYAIHIKNLHIFDKPRELYDYGMDFPISPICKAPQNMMYANGIGVDKQGRYILISIKPEWLCKILNGKKTIEVRKKVLKEMLI